MRRVFRSHRSSYLCFRDKRKTLVSQRCSPLHLTLPPTGSHPSRPRSTFVNIATCPANLMPDRANPAISLLVRGDRKVSPQSPRPAPTRNFSQTGSNDRGKVPNLPLGRRHVIVTVIVTYRVGFFQAGPSQEQIETGGKPPRARVATARHWRSPGDRRPPVLPAWILPALAIVAAQELVGGGVADDDFFRPVPLDTAAKLVAEHAQE